MQERIKRFSHRAGCLRKKYKLTPIEAVWCALWLSGAEEEKIPSLSVKVLNDRNQKAVMFHDC